MEDEEAEADAGMALTQLAESFPNPQSYNYRILKALLEHAPTEAGRQNIAREIIDISSSQTPTLQSLEDLGNRYLKNLLVPSEP
jgi:hypothetical protein